MIVSNAFQAGLSGIICELSSAHRNKPGFESRDIQDEAAFAGLSLAKRIGNIRPQRSVRRWMREPGSAEGFT
jgi:hypothetical protein